MHINGNLIIFIFEEYNYLIKKMFDLHKILTTKILCDIFFVLKAESIKLTLNGCQLLKKENSCLNHRDVNTLKIACKMQAKQVN